MSRNSTRATGSHGASFERQRILLSLKVNAGGASVNDEASSTQTLRWHIWCFRTLDRLKHLALGYSVEKARASERRVLPVGDINLLEGEDQSKAQ